MEEKIEIENGLKITDYSYKINIQYYRARSKQALKNFFAPIGGPRRKAWFIHLKMKRKLGIGLNRIRD